MLRTISSLVLRQRGHKIRSRLGNLPPTEFEAAQMRNAEKLAFAIVRYNYPLQWGGGHSRLGVLRARVPSGQYGQYWRFDFAISISRCRR